jgi:hypothetical protein
MRKIRDVLRLKLEARLSHERIAASASLGISKGVVAKYVGLAMVAGLDWAAVQALSDTALERRLVQGRVDRPTHYVLPDYGRAHQELRRADGSRAHIFVAALDASSYTFAWASPARPWPTGCRDAHAH